MSQIALWPPLVCLSTRQTASPLSFPLLVAFTRQTDSPLSFPCWCVHPLDRYPSVLPLLACPPSRQLALRPSPVESGSLEFDRFVHLLGDKVRLKGWDKYRGGLDVKGDMTGKHSVYTIYEGHEVMFHVSTMLPYSKDNRQQVERKRHIGNDIVNIVFLDGGPTQMNHFNPSFIKSQFTRILLNLMNQSQFVSNVADCGFVVSGTHVFSLVTHVPEDNSYRLAVYSEESVPLFGPSLPCPPIFRDSQEFREFLLVKVINGEKAAFNTPTFAQKRERTLDMLIKDLYGEQMNEGRGAMLNRRAFSDVLPDPPRSSRRKEEARQLNTIVKGDAPTSLATTGMFKRAPWEPHCFYPDFSHEIVCGDSWGDSRLLVATEDGVFLVEESSSHRLIFDKTVAVKQLHVVEAHGILLFRVDKGRDSKIHVFRLSDFDGELSGETTTRGRADLKEHRLERTRGCQMYVISRPGGSHLRMVSTWCQMYVISRPGGSHLRMVSTWCRMYAIIRPGGSHLRMPSRRAVVPPAIVSAILVARAIETRFTDLTEISGSTSLRLELCQASVVVDQKRSLR
uniref:Rap-GAP domain-containing protein n=1 Tax=Timema shepardi TaxID=629360 RepID=A0A7R9FYY2_TIMSH|nr:unnamed protein product [Timema shepardi]